MSAAATRRFATLAREAVQDAVRRRVVAAITVMSLLSLMLVDSCTSCAAGTATIDGRITDVVNVAGWTGAVTFVVLGLWTVVLAGVLASEHLVKTLADGSAVLCLARPVGRGNFALARLAGALAIALAAGAVLLGGTAGLFHVRSGLALAPALAAGGACALGMVAGGSLAMLASLYLGRTAALLFAFALTAVVGAANFLSLAGAELTGFLGAVDRFGPPLLSAITLGLSGWIPEASLPADPTEVALRLLGWAGAGVALLCVAFRRLEIAS
jgi:ABC-type transport system involved in multi-copper enzyme maturation permease subunit